MKKEENMSKIDMLYQNGEKVKEIKLQDNI